MAIEEKDVIRVFDTKDNFTGNRIKEHQFGYAIDTKEIVVRDSAGYHFYSDSSDIPDSEKSKWDAEVILKPKSTPSRTFIGNEDIDDGLGRFSVQYPSNGDPDKITISGIGGAYTAYNGDYEEDGTTPDSNPAYKHTTETLYITRDSLNVYWIIHPNKTNPVWNTVLFANLTGERHGTYTGINAAAGQDGTGVFTAGVMTCPYGIYSNLGIAGTCLYTKDEETARSNVSNYGNYSSVNGFPVFVPPDTGGAVELGSKWITEDISGADVFKPSATYDQCHVDNLRSNQFSIYAPGHVIGQPLATLGKDDNLNGALTLYAGAAPYKLNIQGIDWTVNVGGFNIPTGYTYKINGVDVASKWTALTGGKIGRNSDILLTRSAGVDSEPLIKLEDSGGVGELGVLELYMYDSATSDKARLNYSLSDDWLNVSKGINIPATRTYKINGVDLNASHIGAEPALGSPVANNYILSSTAAGVRSWIDPLEQNWASKWGQRSATSIEYTASSPQIYLTASSGNGGYIMQRGGTVPVTNDRLGYSLFAGIRTGTTYYNTCGIQAFASEDWVNNANLGSYFSFETTSEGTGQGRSTRLEIRSSRLVNETGQMFYREKASSPSSISNFHSIHALTDGTLRSKDDAGTEFLLNAWEYSAGAKLITRKIEVSTAYSLAVGSNILRLWNDDKTAIDNKYTQLAMLAYSGASTYAYGFISTIAPTANSTATDIAFKLRTSSGSYVEPLRVKSEGYITSNDIPLSIHKAGPSAATDDVVRQTFFDRHMSIITIPAPSSTITNRIGTNVYYDGSWRFTADFGVGGERGGALYYQTVQNIGVKHIFQDTANTGRTGDLVTFRTLMSIAGDGISMPELPSSLPSGSTKAGNLAITTDGDLYIE